MTPDAPTQPTPLPRRNARREGATGPAREATSPRGASPKEPASRGAGGNRRTAPKAVEPAEPDAPRASLHERIVAFRTRFREASVGPLARMRRVVTALGRVSLMIVALVGAGAVGRLAERHVRTSPAFAIRTIAVRGQERLDEASILRAAGLAVGSNVFDVPPEDVQARLLRHPWIASAEVRRRLPATFEIRIRERRAAAMIVLDRLYLVGQDATVFKAVEQGDPVDVPILTGLEVDRFTGDRGYRSSILLDVVALLHDYRAAGLAQRESLAEIHVESDDTVSVYLGDDATYVRLGRGPYLPKLRKLRRVLDELARRESRAAYVYLDNVRRPDRVTVRLRETSVPVLPTEPAHAAPRAL